MRATSRVSFLLLSCLAFILLLAACGVDRDADPRFIRIAITSNPQSLDPALATDVNGGALVAHLFNGLVRFEGATVVPDLADTWSVSADGREYLFRLKPGIRFHHGRELTAADVEASFRRLLDPATGSKRTWILDAVDTFAALDPSTVRFLLKNPSPPFLSLLAMPAGAIVPVEEAARLGAEFARRPIGTGPFRFDQWEDDRSVRLLRNDDYFETPAAAAGIVYRVVPEPLTQLALLKRGGLDICEIPDAQLPALREDPTWRDRIRIADQLVVGYVAINTGRFPDPRVRQAMNLAIDREAIIRAVRANLATPAEGPVPPSLAPRHPPGYRYDPERAKELLRAAGFASNRAIRLLRNAPRATLEPAEAIAGYLRDAGFQVTVEPMEFSAMRARVNAGDFDLCLLNWYADYADAENFLAPLFHSARIGSAGNRARLADSAVDAAIDALAMTYLPEERGLAILKAESRILDRAPWIFLWYPHLAVAVAPRVEGYRPPVIFNGEKGINLRIVAP
jgi:peptide/nickel transport system substrate-binding protein/oligopeptide transport system substrate-binding protein